MSECIETGADGSALSLMDVVGQETDMSEVMAGRETLDQLRQAVKNCLTDQERQVVELRYGLTGLSPKRQREVAQLTGISRSYV